MLKKIAATVAGSAGLDIRRVASLAQARGEVRRDLMVRHNRINAVVDVGANLGQYGVELRRYGYAGTIYSFEPLRGPYQSLEGSARRDGNWRTFNSAVGDEDGEVVIHVSENKVSSSLTSVHQRSIDAEPGSAFVSDEHVKLCRLDTVLTPILQPDDRVFLKIDAQGYEHRVIRGASGLLDRVQMMECEMSMFPLYEGEYLFTEMINFLKELGFVPVDFTQVFCEPQSGYCLQMNGIFVRS